VPGLAVGYLVVTIFFWGTSFRASAIAAEDTSAIWISALRSVPAAILLVAAVVLLRGRFPAGRQWLWAAITGVLMVVLTLEGISEGTARAGAGNAAVLLNSTPFFVLILSRIFLRERFAALGVAGLLVGFAGIVVMVSSQLGGVEDTGNFVLGMVFALVGALAWGSGALILKGVVFPRWPDLDMVGFTGAQYLVGGPILLALAFAIEGTGGTAWSSSGLWGAIVWLGVGSGAIATLAFFGALKRMSATTVTAWQFLAPVVAVVVEIVYGNTPSAVVLVGMVLAIVGVALVNIAPQSQPEPSARPVEA
jgi:drug/metabolite transporter (DMT)-like permease